MALTIGRALDSLSDIKLGKIERTHANGMQELKDVLLNKNDAFVESRSSSGYNPEVVITNKTSKKILLAVGKLTLHFELIPQRSKLLS